ncbi:hypothetical protein [Pseudoclavibacter sp. JSM 162008]|uniref:hypothetical protein n=1 Tax=Pseudoclavibacter sp. JSM 162008 TaxID=3229855 RepID=UPI003526239E
MTRSRASAKAAGSRLEREVADYLAEHVDDRIDRRVKTGAVDKGDIASLRTRVGNQRVVVECKNYAGQLKVTPWLGEAETERVNDGAVAGIVVAKRAKTQKPGEQIVFMTVADLAALLTGTRPQPTLTTETEPAP